MSASEQTHPGHSRVRIAGPMTIYTAAEWRDTLLAATDAAGNVELDLSGVNDIDAAGIQLLVSLRMEAQACARALRLVATSERIREALAFCHLTEFFEDAPLAQS